MVYKKNIADRLFDAVVYLLLAVVVVLTLYPLVYVLSMSISDPQAALRGDVLLLPKGFSLKAYRVVLANKDLWRYYYNTLWYTAVGTVLNVAVTVLAAYPLSKKTFRPRDRKSVV